jgi:hypothetical protein
VAFFNGVTYELTLEDVPSLGIQYRTRPAAADKIKGARVQALFWVRGEGWKEADWTNQPSVRFCRDLKSQRIDELILIISNSEFKDPERRLRPPALAVRVGGLGRGTLELLGRVHRQRRLIYDRPAFFQDVAVQFHTSARERTSQLFRLRRASPEDQRHLPGRAPRKR